jgi:3-oxoacyl-[acyl-carrier-protein] synthase-3
MSHLRSRISGLGMCVPPSIVSNTDLTRWMETSDEWISQRTGIRERRWVVQDTANTTSGLALDACREALAEACLEATDVGLIVFATLSPDCVFPGSACFLQALLGVPGIPALDIRQQCTGFVYGLSIADLYVRAGLHRHVLVVCSEIQSKALDKSTRGREMTVLFGDGAGAVVVSATEVQDDSPRSKESFLISHHLHADGSFAEDLVFRSPGTSNRIWNPPELVLEREAHPQMNGRVVFQNAVKRMPEVAREAIAANGLSVDDVDLFVNHQANKRINDKFAESLGVPSEKVFDTIERYGNTTAATIPIGLHEAVRAGRLQRGMLVLSAAFGSGFTWGASLFRW